MSENMQLLENFMNKQMHIPISAASVWYGGFSLNYRDIAYLILLGGSEREIVDTPKVTLC